MITTHHPTTSTHHHSLDVHLQLQLFHCLSSVCDLSHVVWHPVPLGSDRKTTAVGKTRKIKEKNNSKYERRYSEETEKQVTFNS